MREIRNTTRGNGYVFINPDSAKPYADIKTAFETACQLAGIENLHWHDQTGTRRLEQLGGLHILEARDLAHVTQLISQHPGIKYRSIEIRPVADLSERMKESEQRRRRKDTSRMRELKV